MKNRAVIAGVITLLTVLSAFAVLPATPARAAATTADKTLYVAMQQDLPDFNTWNLASNGVWKSNVINWGFEALAGLDYNMVPYPLLAESWTFYESNLTVLINLRHDVHFHDGTTMTADDVVFIYTAARTGTTYSSNIVNAFDANGDGAVNLTEIQAGVQKINDYRIKMTMAVPYGQFFTSTLGVVILPKHIWEHHLTADGLIDVLWGNDPAAAIGTGPYYYKEGTSSVYRIMQKFPDYWGKDFRTPYLDYAIYPPNVDTIYYKIYASIDTAILALQAGAVDYISWPVTPGRVATMQADPNIGMQYMAENGYYYLTFNEKLQPMNSLPFRQAISHLIDKDQIVNVYMGGFGSKGDATEPPFWGEWHNSSVNQYPYDDPTNMTTTVPEDLLDNAGFVDVNGDGWRELPGGAPMEKIILLTPPADYDPIRPRAGQMIAKNMREVGINCEAKAIDFDTLVARMQGMSYQMLMLGWSLTSDTVGNVFDICAPKANQNNQGFWNASDPNPFYKDLLGVNTLADRQTQDLANEVTRLANLARQSFDVSDQMLYTRWGEGVLADAVNVNVLYYKVAIEAYRNSWEGWIPYLGSLWSNGANIFCLSSLHKAGTTVIPGGATNTVNAGLSLPGQVGFGQSAAGFVIAVDNKGDPVAGASVAFSMAGVAGAATVTVSPSTGTTDAKGILDFTVTGTGAGQTIVNATVTSGTASSVASRTINSLTELPPTLYLAVTPESLVLNPGESTAVNLAVTDQFGDPVEGAACALDPNLMSYGTVDDATVTTDAAGHASTMYNAPTTINQLNSHLIVTLSYTVSKAGYMWTTAAATNLLVYNDAAPDWVAARITDVTTTALDSGANTTTITVRAEDDSGAALPSHWLAVTYSNDSMVVSPVDHLVTDGTGVASVDVTVRDLTDSAALRVTIANNTVLNGVPAVVTLTYVGTNPPAAEMYGGYITYAESSVYMGPLGTMTATAWLWDSAGNAADGINASLILSATPYGSLVGTDLANYDSLVDYLAINIVTTADQQNLVTSGPMNTYFDEANWEAWGPNGAYYMGWDWGTLTGVDINGGSLTFWVNGTDVAQLDQLASIYIVPQGVGTFSGVTLGYEIDGMTTIQSNYVIGRTYHVAAPSFSIASPVLTVLQSDFQTTTVSMTVTDETGAALEGADAMVYENSATGNKNFGVEPSADPSWSDPIQTDVNGQAEATIIAAMYGTDPLTATAQPTVFVKASMTGYLSVFGQTQIFEYTPLTFVTIWPISDIIPIGQTGITIVTQVTAWNGSALPDMTVTLSPSMGEVVAPTNTTDSNGFANFTLNAPILYKTRVDFISLEAKAGGPGWSLSTGDATITIRNREPRIEMSVVGADGSGGSKVNGNQTISLVGIVSDEWGLKYVNISVDIAAAQAVPGPAFGSVDDKSRDLGRSLGNLSDGNHTVTVTAVDGLGVSTEMSMTFNVKTVTAPVTPKAKTDIVPWVIAAIGWIVAVLVLVMMMMRRPKGPTTMKAAEPEVAEEELPKR
jgi:peptide/nickel transport system substrate-binding protein